MPRRAFVGFFGLNRSARWTAPSIHRNLLGPLRDAGFELFLAGHFNQPGVIDNARSNERGVTLNDDVTPLRLDVVSREPQTEANIADLLPAALSVPWHGKADDDGRIRRNLLQQLHSLRRLRQMLERAGGDFDFYALLRPDLEYIDRLDVQQLAPLLADGADMLTPDWHQWDGLNDRFAFCNRKGADAFLGRWRLVEAFCRTHGYIHSEGLLAYAAKEADLRVVTTGLRAVRVRATGWTWGEGFRLSPWLRVRFRFRSVVHGIRG